MLRHHCNVSVLWILGDGSAGCTFTNRIDDVGRLYPCELFAFDVRPGLNLLELLHWAGKELSWGRQYRSLSSVDEAKLTLTPLPGTDHLPVDKQGRGSQAIEYNGSMGRV